MKILARGGPYDLFSEPRLSALVVQIASFFSNNAFQRNADKLLRIESHCFGLLGRPICSTHASGQVHDIIQLSSPVRDGIIQKITDLSACGKSQRQIALELKVSKTFVQSALNQDKMDFPAEEKAQNPSTKSAICARYGASPFGFEVLDGQLVEHPRELRTAQRIIDLELRPRPKGHRR